MANTPLLFSGAETGSLALEAANSGGSSAIVANPSNFGSFGARCFQVNPSLAGVGNIIFDQFSLTTGKNAALGIAHLFASFHFRVDTLPASGNEMAFGMYTSTNNTTLVGKVHISSGGILSVFNSSGVLIATGTAVLTTTTKYKIDFDINITTGAYTLSVNGVQDSANTTAAQFGATNIGNFTFGKVVNTGGNTVNFYYDNLWLDSAGFAPASFDMVVDVPQSFAANAWTTDQGGAGLAVIGDINAIPAVNTSFIQDPASASLPVDMTANMQTFAQMGITGATPLGVQVFANLKDVTLLTNTVKVGLRSNVTDSVNSTAQNTSASFVNFGRCVALDPNGGGAWTQSGIEAMLYKVTEGTASVNTALASASMTVVISPPVAGTATQTTKSRIQNNQTATQTTKSRIQKSFTATQSTLSRISAALTALQTTKSRIQNSLTQTTTTISRISKALTSTQSTKSRISAALTALQTTKSRIQNAFTQTTSTKSRIQKAFTATQATISKIQSGSANLTQTTTTKSRVRKNQTATQSTKSSIASPRLKTGAFVTDITLQKKGVTVTLQAKKVIVTLQKKGVRVQLD